MESRQGLSCLLLAITAIGGSSWSLLADQLGPSAKLFDSRYQELKVAMASREASAIASLLAAEFISEDVDGKQIDASEMIRQLKATAPDPNRKSETTVLSVAVDGSAAEVKQQYEMNGKRENPASHASEQVRLLAVSTDSWVQTNGVWLLKKTVTRSLDYWVNGEHKLHKDHR